MNTRLIGLQLGLIKSSQGQSMSNVISPLFDEGQNYKNWAKGQANNLKATGSSLIETFKGYGNSLQNAAYNARRPSLQFTGAATPQAANVFNATNDFQKNIARDLGAGARNIFKTTSDSLGRSVNNVAQFGRNIGSLFPTKPTSVSSTKQPAPQFVQTPPNIR